MFVKRISIKEFREFGFLQEANRIFFHPLGLALEVVVDGETGEERLGGIRDYRDDPEGVVFDEGMIDPEMSLRVMWLMRDKSETRRKSLGFVVQPAVKGELS